MGPINTSVMGERTHTCTDVLAGGEFVVTRNPLKSTCDVISTLMYSYLSIIFLCAHLPLFCQQSNSICLFTVYFQSM